MQDPLDRYLSELIAAKGLSDSPETRDALAEQVNNTLDQALIEALPLAQLDKLEAATKDGGEVADGFIEQLLSEAGIDSDKIIVETLESFRDSYMKGGNDGEI